MNVKAALKASVEGDVNALNILREVPHEGVAEAAEGMELVLTRESLAIVLRKLMRQDISETHVQQWASFMRRGFIARQRRPIRPISIEYQSCYDQQIADIIARLDEIGDVVDGDPPTEGEISDFLALLGLADVNRG